MHTPQRGRRTFRALAALALAGGALLLLQPSKAIGQTSSSTPITSPGTMPNGSTVGLVRAIDDMVDLLGQAITHHDRRTARELDRTLDELIRALDHRLERHHHHHHHHGSFHRGTQTAGGKQGTGQSPSGTPASTPPTTSSTATTSGQAKSASNGNLVSVSKAAPQQASSTAATPASSRMTPLTATVRPHDAAAGKAPTAVNHTARINVAPLARNGLHGASLLANKHLAQVGAKVGQQHAKGNASLVKHK